MACVTSKYVSDCQLIIERMALRTDANHAAFSPCLVVSRYGISRPLTVGRGSGFRYRPRIAVDLWKE